MEGDCKNVCQIGDADHRNSSAQRYMVKMFSKVQKL